MNELTAAKASARRSDPKTPVHLIDTARMVEIIKARHIASDRRLRDAEKSSPEEEKIQIFDTLDRLRSGEAHSSILAASISPTAMLTAVMLERLEARNAFLDGQMSLEEAINALNQKPGAPCHPIMSRFRCLEALLAAGIVQPNFSDRTIKPTMSIPATREIMAIVSEKTGIAVSRIKSAERSSDVVRARFLAIFILRYVSILTLSQIGTCIGGRDHTTVLNSLNQTRQNVFADVGEAFSTHELCNVIDLMGQKKYCEFLVSQRSLSRPEDTRSDGTPRRVRLSTSEDVMRLEYRRAMI